MTKRTAAESTKREDVAQSAIRLVGARPKDGFTLVETIIDEIRALPADEAMSTAGFYSVEGAEIRRRNERRAAARAVAFEQLAAALLADERLRTYLRRAGL